MTDALKPLSGLRVVDLGLGLAAALAARLLADAGAEIMRFEPPGGDPFGESYPAYRFWQQDKTPGGGTPGALQAALAGAQMCILGGEAHPDLDWRQDAAALAAAHPGLAILEIRAAPDESFPAVELFAQARSGLVFEHHADRPIMFAFPAASYGAALHGVTALLAAHYARRDGRRGAIVSTSLLQGALAWCAGIWAEVETPPPSFGALIPKDVVDARFRCADGEYVHFTPGVPGSYAKLYHVLGIDDPSIDPNARGIPTGGADPKRYFGDMERISAHAADKPSRAVLDGLNAEGLPVERVREPGDCWDLGQAVVNGIIARDAAGWQRVGNPIAAQRLRDGAQSVPVATGPAASGPLAGVRVVDFGCFAAGPYSSVVLGDLGADVIKLERLEGDPMRASFHHYSASNRGKRCIAVDAKSAAGAAVIARICASADIVHHNFRPGVSAKLGIDAAALSRLNPRIIVLEASAYGAQGPMAHLPGFDPLFQAIAGHQRLAGGAGNPPLYYRLAIADYGNGLIGAAALVEALLARQQDGRGTAAFVNLLNSAIFLLSELVRRPDGSFERPAPMAADHLGCHPAEALYQAADGWIAIAARGEAMAGRLAEALGVEAGARAGWGAGEKAALAAAIRPLASAAILARLNAADVWAVACAPSISSVMAAPEMAEIGMVFTVEDARCGTIRQVGRAVAIEGADLANAGRGRLEAIGGSTREILRECGYAAAEIDDLFAAGVVA